MVPDGIKERFELYQKWLKTLLIQEFMDLPTKYQEKFMTLIEKFTEDCKKIHEEGKAIKEKVIKLTIVEVIPIYEKGRDTTEKFQVYCKSSELENKVVLTVTPPEPIIGNKLYYTVYSIEGDVWYSSKKELIKSIKRNLS